VTTVLASAPRFRLKLFPLVIVTALGVAVPYLAAYLAFFSSKVFHTPSPHGPTLPWLYLQHGLQFLIALVAIAIVKGKVPADYGLHWPRGKTYIAPAALWSALFGVIMTVIDYAPQLITHTKPDLGFPLTTANVVGWLFFESVYVGPTEEVPFRALLVTYLATAMPGKFRVGRFEMNWASWRRSSDTTSATASSTRSCCCGSRLSDLAAGALRSKRRRASPILAAVMLSMLAVIGPEC